MAATPCDSAQRWIRHSSRQAEAVDWGVVMAVVTLSVFPTLVIYLMLQRYFVKGIVMTGLKG